MAFSDQPPPSLLRIWPLVPLGRLAARLVHRAQPLPDGGLLSAKHFIPADTVWRLGQSYLGLLGLLALPLSLLYVDEFHQATGYFHYYHDVLGRRVAEHRLGFWSDLPADLKVILPLTFLLHAIGLVSAARCLLVRRELRPASEAGWPGGQ